MPPLLESTTAMPSSPPSRPEALAAVPVRSTDIRVQTTGQGLVRIISPMRVRTWLSRILPKSFTHTTRTLELDAMGSFVWQHIDGKNSVQTLAEIVVSHYQCHPSEAKHAVAAFIRQLGQRGIVGLIES